MRRRRSSGPRGPASRTACRGLRCSRCTRESSGSARRPGTTRRSRSSGGRDTTPTSSPSATSRCSRSGGCPTIDEDGSARRGWPGSCATTSAIAGSPIARSHARSAVGNSIRYAATTGTIAIRWEGARAPVIWVVEPDEIDPADARRELARRYLHLFGPTNASSFARWAGVSRRAAGTTFAVARGPRCCRSARRSATSGS